MTQKEGLNGTKDILRVRANTTNIVSPGFELSNEGSESSRNRWGRFIRQLGDMSKSCVNIDYTEVWASDTGTLLEGSDISISSPGLEVGVDVEGREGGS
jgi:hypothetical protein